MDSTPVPRLPRALRNRSAGQRRSALDLTSTKAIGDLDTRSGMVEAEPGAAWPDLMRALDERQPGERSPWCIIQKQTGADNLTLGGAIAANIHGRGLRFRPFVQDLESFTLLTASGEEIQCSRRENPDSVGFQCDLL